MTFKFNRAFTYGLVLIAVSWLLAPQLVFAQTVNAVKINFQPVTSLVPTGYIPDSGELYGTREGYTFGWSINHSDVVRARGVNSDPILDTLSHFHTGSRWEIALPAGSYIVKVSAGDACFASAHTINIEGVNNWTALALPPNQFINSSKTILVSDGRLTIDCGAAGEKQTRINYVEIMGVAPTATPTPTPTPTGVVPLPLLQISDNGRFLSGHDGKPFFWLGDTAWFLFRKLTREEAEMYLENRRQKGFNVIQVMTINSLSNSTNVYGDAALINGRLATPLTTNGNNPADPNQYDFWDHADYIVDLAASKGIYLALICIWGSNIGSVTINDARVYAQWLANRYKNRPNIIWLNGGDVDAIAALATWKAIGETLRQADTNHLITFHPRGRLQSSDWFHQESWLDFNMFQSGHRTYEQDDTIRNYGEDNWRYVKTDYELLPMKPTLDGEPSYEGIPQGLHDATQPYWNENDVRRYAYWSVFGGACGHTYGHNAVF